MYSIALAIVFVTCVTGALYQQYYDEEPLWLGIAAAIVFILVLMPQELRQAFTDYLAEKVRSL